MDFQNINPWSVENLEEFLYFCCPECDDRNQSRNTFLEHALHQHPTSKEYLLKFIVKNEILLEENFNESESDDNQIIPSLIVKCDIKEEYDKAVYINTEFKNCCDKDTTENIEENQLLTMNINKIPE